MAEQSMFWTTNGTGHGVVSGFASNRWQAFVKKMFTSDQTANACVLNQVDNELAVSGTASPVAVASGAAIDHSFFYENDASLNLAVATPSVGLTGGHVVLRASWATQLVQAVAVRNTDGVAAIPALTQVANTTWEVRLATFTITTGGVIALTDVRKKTKFSNHVYANGFDISAIDNTTIGLSSGALQVKNAGVTATQLAAAVAGNGLSGGAGTALAVNVDATTIEINADILRVKDDGIDDLKVGNRVMQFYRRQGGSATDWSDTSSATNQTPTMVRAQGGAGVTNVSGSFTLTYPTAFSDKPLIFLFKRGASSVRIVHAQSETNTGCTITSVDTSNVAQGSVLFNWLAIGPQ